MAVEEGVDEYTQDGTVGLKGNPVLRSKRGGWTACSFVIEMARRLLSNRRNTLLLHESVRTLLNIITQLCIFLFQMRIHHYETHMLKSKSLWCPVKRDSHLYKMIYESDLACKEQLRMDRRTFSRLCHMVRNIGKLNDTKHVTVEEMVAIFLYALANHFKNRTMKNKFMRSGETISRHFGDVLAAVMRLQSHLLKKPLAISDNCTNHRWKSFKNCLGALDGTYIEVHVNEVDKPRYRTRKSKVASNVLGVCSPDMQFIYILPGWEGSAQDSRDLRDAISRRHGLKIPQGYYYLADAGYPHASGVLAPYRGQKYHRKEFNGNPPETKEELFNLKHSCARNVIERCFGLLKKRWAILRSPSFFPIAVQNRIIIACALIHNLLRIEMPTDLVSNVMDEAHNFYEPHGEPYTHIGASEEWTAWRENRATEMFEEWNAVRNA